jgi:hypothetical protein
MLGTRPFPNVIGSRPRGGSTAPSTLYFHETEDTDWDNGANWYEEITGTIQWNLVPTAAQHAIIQSGTCDGDGTCASLVVASGGTLTTNSGTLTTNNGTVTTNFAGATVTTNNGTVNTNASGATIIDHNSGATVGLNNGTITTAASGSIITDEGTGIITNDNR